MRVGGDTGIGEIVRVAVYEPLADPVPPAIRSPAMRACAVCESSLEGRRPQARFSCGACRAEASRQAQAMETAQKLQTFDGEDLALARSLRNGIDVTVAVRLRPQAERDRALLNHVETVRFFDT